MKNKQEGSMIDYEGMINNVIQWDLDRSLIRAIEAKDVLAVEKSIGDGANIHAKDEAALRLAARNGHIDIVKFLVAQGADIHADDDDALRVAAEFGQLDIVRYLVDQGADVHARDDFALRWAASKGHLDIVKFLVRKGADIHAEGENGDIPCAFSRAAERGHLDIVIYLFEQGFDIRFQKYEALEFAASWGRLEIVKFLLEKGAPIEVAKENGTDAVKDFCKAYELRSTLGQKLGSHTPSKSKSPRLKI